MQSARKLEIPRHQVRDFSQAQWLRLSFLSVTVLLILGSVFFLIWRCQFGVDLTDESAYLAMGFKLMSLGDRPFVDEIFIGPKNFYLLNSLIGHFLPFSVHMLRVAAVGLYSLILLFITWMAFSGRPGVLGGLSFAACLLFDRFNMPTWSHNWWCRNFLLIHQGLLLIAASKKNGSKRWFVFAAGISLGTCVVVYNTLVFALALSALSLAYFIDDEREQPSKWYLSGALLPGLIYLGYLVKSDITYEYLRSWGATSTLEIYSKPFLSHKVFPALNSLITSPWWALVIVGWLIPQELGPKKMRTMLPWALSVAFLVNVLALNIGQTMSLFLGLAAGATLLLFYHSSTRPILAVLSVAGASTMLLMGVSSSTTVALFWAVPALVIPFLGFYSSENTNQAGYSLGFVCGWVFLVLLGAFRYQIEVNYEDVAPGDAVAEVKVAPFQGLYTSERRAFLLEALSKVSGTADYALAHMAVPGTFMFGKVKSSVPFLFEDISAPPALQHQALIRMAERKRFPDVMILAKTHPWTWGIGGIIPSSIVYPEWDPLARYIRCAAGEIIFSCDEFEAYRADPAKVSGCVLYAQAKT
jgi:hypothetical protein